MVRRGTVKETEIAAAVVRWLVDMEWTVYQEVSLGGRVIDLVATRGPLVWAIECKVSLGLAVLEQAYGLLGYAHYVSVAVREPTSEDSVVRWFAEQVVAAEHGIGVIERDVEHAVGDEPMARAPAGGLGFQLVHHGLGVAQAHQQATRGAGRVLQDVHAEQHRHGRAFAARRHGDPAVAHRTAVHGSLSHQQA